MMRNKFAILLMLVAFFPLWGCGGNTEKQPVSEDYALCGQTSGGTMAETADGFYYVFDSVLRYADKSDLTTWIPVCAEPECEHGAAASCHANVSGEFALYNDRIYFGDSYQAYSDDNATRGQIIASMATDGSDRKVAYVLKGLANAAGTGRLNVLPGQILACWSCLEEDGKYSTHIVQLDVQGEHILFEGTAEEDNSIPGISARLWSGVWGDGAFYTGYLGDEDVFAQIYIPASDGLKRLDVSGLNMSGAYLSGTTLQCFISGDGYYDVDLTTGEKTKVMDAQLECSASRILLGDEMIFESALLPGPATNGQLPEGTDKSLLYYDGSQWQEVQLPENLTNPQANIRISPVAIASDRVFFAHHPTPETCELYYMLLDGEPLELVHCADF